MTSSDKPAAGQEPARLIRTLEMAELKLVGGGDGEGIDPPTRPTTGSFTVKGG